MPNGVVIHAGFILRAGLAIDNMAAAVYQRLQEAARFFCKRVFGSVTRSVDPPNLTARRGRGQRVQHREYGCSPDAGTEENHRRVTGPQSETSARRTGLQAIADVYADREYTS